MSAVKLCIIGIYLSVIVAFVCITYAALHFDNASILWWYLVPLCMSSVDVSSKEDEEEDNDEE